MGKEGIWKSKKRKWTLSGFLGKKAVNRGTGAGGSSNRGSPVYNVVKSILCDIRFLAKRRKLMRLKMVFLSFPPAESVFLGDL